MGRQIEPRTWVKYQTLRESGMGRRDAAKKVGISYTVAGAYDRGEISTTASGKARTAKELVKSAEEVIPPKPWSELCEEAQRAINDFAYFRRRYLGRDAKPWQEEAATLLVELEETPEREWCVINVPPGSGKSTTFTHDIPAWLITRGRVLNSDVRILIGSRTQRQANQYGRRLRSTLERTRPVEGAEEALVTDYGQYRPTRDNLWRSEEFIVWENPDEMPGDEKEPTAMCAGMDTGFLGGRFNFVIWDDLVDASTIRTEEARNRQREWFDDEAETRLEPAGLFVLQGQRLSSDDLYSYALGKPGVLGDGEEDPDVPKYRHVVFPAHDEERCEEDHERDSPPWPEGCLLDPVRLSWRDLMVVKQNNPRKFDIIMQQKDVDPAGSLVPREFIFGGDYHNIELPGCVDDDRSLCQLPDTIHDHSALISAISVDPSPTKFWSMQWWVYDPHTEYRWLMDIHRAAMDAPDFLDRLRDGRYVGLAEDWLNRASELSLPVSCVIVERNAAQRFLLQHEYVQDWTAKHGISLIPHDTHHGNKADENFGVQMLRSLYMNGRVRLPHGEAHTRSIVSPLIDEVTVWPNGRTDDCVMAQWMFEWNLPNLTVALAPIPARRDIPSWVRKKVSA